MEPVVVLRDVAGPQVLSDAAAALDKQWAIYGWVPESVRIQIGIAVAEILANIVEHGSAGRHLVQIEIQVGVAADRVVVTVYEDGHPHLGDIAAVSMPDGFAERGRGLAMAKYALADLAYRREGHWNSWVLASRTF